MTKTRKRVLIVCVVPVSGVLLAICFLRAAYWRSGPFPIASMRELPCASRVLRGIKASGPLAYVHLSTWRVDVFYVRGFTSQEDLLAMKAQNPGWTLWDEGQFTQPPRIMAAAIKAFDGLAPLSWTSRTLFLEGFDENHAFVSIACDPDSGLFYARLAEHLGTKKPPAGEEVSR